MLTINIEGEELSLLKEKAIYWAVKNTLIVADLHWGKTGHFRKNGIAIPLTTQQSDEIRLSNLIKTYNIKTLIVAGDFFHSTENNETDSFAHWRKAHNELEIVLVAGNHDILAREQYASWDITVHDELLDLGAFIIAHDFIEHEKFCLQGHIHPSYSIEQKGQRNIKLSCFCSDDKRMVLPAFGSFTGTHKMNKENMNNIYVITDEGVIKWK